MESYNIDYFTFILIGVIFMVTIIIMKNVNKFVKEIMKTIILIAMVILVFYNI